MNEHFQKAYLRIFLSTLEEYKCCLREQLQINTRTDCPITVINLAFDFNVHNGRASLSLGVIWISLNCSIRTKLTSFKSRIVKSNCCTLKCSESHLTSLSCYTC